MENIVVKLEKNGLVLLKNINHDNNNVSVFVGEIVWTLLNTGKPDAFYLPDPICKDCEIFLTDYRETK